MKKIFTHLLNAVTGLFFLFILMTPASLVHAQITCNNATVLWSEDFDTGTTASSSPDVLPSGLYYQATKVLATEGSYRVINNTQQKPEWLLSPDHTGNTDGKMLVVNGQAETFFQHTVTSVHGFSAGNYTVSMYVMNIDSMGICSPDPLLPIMTFTVEYLSEANTWVPLTHSPYTAAAVPQTAKPVWVNLGSTFTLPLTGSFIPSQIRITLGDGTVGGCGNDFAMDDIQFALCPEGGPMPIELTAFSARHKGGGVSLDWSTSQELDNSYFQVERSADGSTGWAVVATVNGAGNSQVVRNYNAFDATPLTGENYYRLKQVDYDGKAVYSKTITIKMDVQKTGISVFENPFRSTLSVNFASPVSQLVSARLLDITGKQVAVEKWSVSNGNTKKDFTNVNGLQQGMYILEILSPSGEILYNAKVIKQ